jgi:transcriptional regulator with XRE-family HTH domain
MTDNHDEPGNGGRVGRPARSAEPSPEAGDAARRVIRDKNLTQASVAARMGVSERQLSRWLGGTDRGPTLEQAQALAEVLETPALVDLWWPPGGVTGGNHRRLLVGGGLLAVLLVVGIALLFTRDDDPADPSPTPTSLSSAAARPVATGPITAVVDGTFANNRPQAKTIGLWTRPGMSTGCDLDDCPAGTKQAGRVDVGATLAVSCVVLDGQMLRNGASGEPGYYEDERWLRLVPGQDVGEADSDLYISNLWFLRDDLPRLPNC